MLAKTLTFGLSGIDTYPIEVEVDVANGLPAVVIVGLADTAIRESRERIKAAIKNSGFVWPQERITISLAPSDVKKEGTSFDLAIALGILAASGQINAEALKDHCILGELSLDGGLRPVKGILPVAMELGKYNVRNMILPYFNAKEAGIVSGISAFPLKDLKEAAEFFRNPGMIQPFQDRDTRDLRSNPYYAVDFSEVKAQYYAKRAIEVAVAGAHNILMIGPPGSGKTMLAKRIPTIMPDVTLEEVLAITKIHSVAGRIPIKNGIISRRPFYAPHHALSCAALIGGGPLAQPGLISLAHQGVLFLDELPEFSRDCLEALRQPLEDGFIRVARAKASLVFPAAFMLACAMNPCPCGYYTDPRKACRCNPNKIAGYMGKISGPLLDRIDIHIELPAVNYKELTDTKDAEPSAAIKERVEKARLIQRERFKTEGIFFNARMDAKLVKKYCVLEDEAKELLRMAMTELGLSARAYDKVLKVGRTVADLAGARTIMPEHLAEAIQYRSLDRMQ